MTLRTACIVAALGLSLAASGAAADWTLTLDPSATRIAFVLDATMHKVEGTARLTRGEVRFDPATGTASGEVVIDAKSLESGNDKRDRDMHEKVLESEQHGEIALRVEAISGDLAAVVAGGSAELELGGRLSIHGGEHEVRWPVAARNDGGKLAATVTFSIPYVEWGMKDPSKFMLRVAKSVDVEIAAVGTLAEVGE